MRFTTILSVAAAVAAPFTSAITLPDNPSKDDLANAANQVKENMLTFYNGENPGGIPGYMINPDYYFWWQVGGMLGQLINHWALTGNDTYNQLVLNAVNHQSTDNDFFMPKNQSSSEGNDDQAFWAFAALDAAETNFPPLANGLSWLGLAQGVFNSQVPRWRQDICNGGLEWQINPLNKGANFKNTPTNAGFFQIAARLARFTGNNTYVDQANRMWDWLESVTLIVQDPANPQALQVYDGVPDGTCASARSQNRFTYNNAMLVMGAAYLADYTKDPIWVNRTQMLVKGFSDIYLVKFGATSLNDAFTDNHTVLTETICEFQDQCNSDQPSFKAYVLRWLTVATTLVPSIQDDVAAIMNAAVKGASQQCTGHAPGHDRTQSGLSSAAPGSGNNWCGQHWYQNSWDGWSGFGEQMSAMSAFQNQIVFLNGGPRANNGSSGGSGGSGGSGSAPAAGVPLTSGTGGTSQSNPNAGANANPDQLVNMHWKVITGADKFGAAVMTILGMAIPCAGLWFMFMGD